MSITDDLLANNQRFAEDFDAAAGHEPRILVLTCMDARIDPVRALGLEPGSTHVVRNAGGIVTDDAIRSLTISQRLLGTQEIMVIQHTDCGMTKFDEGEVVKAIVWETGERPPFALGAFADLEESVRQSVASIEASAFIPHRNRVRGFVYDVHTGVVDEVH